MASILFIQTGDFRETYLKLSEGRDETYRDQKKSVDFVASLTSRGRVTTVAFGSENYHAELAPSLWSAGLQETRLSASSIARVFDEAQPTHVVLRTPHIGFLKEVQRRGIHLLPSFADIFVRKGIRTALQNHFVRRALLQCRTPCYSNHSLNASRSLVSVLGLPPEKVVPWDWSKVPLAGGSKSDVGKSTRPTAFFAGAMTEDKGVGDCLEAIAVLRREGINLSMGFAGPGNLEHWTARTEALGISDLVRFLGVVSNAQVREEMRAHDFVIVPSRHSYAEGLPNTIYEGLASRSVLIVSDHPAFTGRLTPKTDCLMFPASQPAALAHCLKQAIRDASLFHRISENSVAAHERLYVGMEWSALVETFLEDPEDETGWVGRNSLESHKDGVASG
jgi:glycosyltransferase involved in cell wall biosynthesis